MFNSSEIQASNSVNSIASNASPHVSLIDAICEENVDVKKIENLLALPQFQATINEVNSQGRTAVHEAAMMGGVEVIELLLLAGANPNLLDDVNSAPLHSAAEQGRAKVVQVLIDVGVNVNPTDKCGNTPLHNAVNFGDATVVEILLENGAEDAPNMKGITPFFDAVRYKNVERACYKSMLLSKFKPN